MITVNKYLTQTYLYILAAIASISCSFGAATPDPVPPIVSLVTGDCLKSTDLDLYKAYKHNHDFYFVFTFKDLDIKYEKPKGSLYQRAFPDDTVFEQFGENASKVEKELDMLWKTMMSQPRHNRYGVAAGPGYTFNINTFFLVDTIHLVSDKEFAGVAAGEDLSSLIHRAIPALLPDGVLPLDSNFSWNNMIPLVGDCLTFAIPLEDFEMVEETVQFSLSIPIKSVQYLKWINDKLTDENASMTWKEGTLTCNFSTSIGLHHKSE